MKNLKFIFLTVIIFFGFLIQLSAQIHAGITSIGSFYACQGEIVSIPLNISNSPDLADISLEIDYNGAVLSYLKTGGLTNPDSNLSLSSGIFAVQNTVSGNSKKLMISWFSSNGNSYAVGSSGTGRICNLNFLIQFNF